MRKFISFAAVVIVVASLGTHSYSQAPKKPTSAEILLALKKLNVLGTALYVAAHPDDENTRLITYLSNEKLIYTAYLSVTRGDGGQNLIGPEIREELGIIRTQELLAARRRDGGTQFFTRANDFGYSKTAEETLSFWEKDKVLADVVWAIRKFRPDVIITRFPPDSRGGHGHHSLSALLAEEAFDIANDPKIYSDQLKYVKTWQPKRILLNTGRWWNQSITAETEGIIAIDVGVFNPLLGQSYTEIASESRSQHKSQGFGSTGTRGSTMEFLEFRKGKKAEDDLFEGIDITWNRVKGGEKIASLIQSVIKEYDFSKPSKIVPDLIDIRKKVAALKDEFWRNRKLNEIDNIIKYSMGLYLEAAANDFSFTPGDSIEINIEAINRSGIPAILTKVVLNGHDRDTVTNLELKNNQRVRFPIKAKLNGMPFSQPYWLVNKPEAGMYNVDDQLKIGLPENDPSLTAMYSIEIDGQTLDYEIPVIYKWRDPVGGELYRPLEITPPVFVNLEQNVVVFANDNPQEINVLIKSGRKDVEGSVSLNLPPEWKIEPAAIDFSLTEKGEEKTVTFSVFPPKEQSESILEVHAQIGGKIFNNSLVRIVYDHIPTQTLFPVSHAKVVKLQIEKKGETIGYIMGTGDDIPASLEQIGYQVWTIKEDEITAQNLESLDAVILGVRALNANDRIKFYMPLLLDYVKAGGTLIVQYNTSRRLKTNEFSPYPLKLSRDRVSEETAEIRILDADHPVLNTPNKITSKDFDGWVQERGLYFPNEWSDEFSPILSSNDTNEDPKDGGLLVAKYGDGYYIYSGYSWFRQLPAGVPGAYRLFTNMISLGNKNSPKNTKLSRTNK